VSTGSEKLTEELLTVSTRNAKLVAENQSLAATLIQINSKVARAEEMLKTSAQQERGQLGKDITGSVVIREHVQTVVELEDDSEIVMSSEQLYGDIK
jgi:hypothetical protein